MTVPTVVQGRGAFRPAGKDNLKSNYQLVVDKPLDGASPTKDVNYQAVNLGVKAIQERINSYGLGYIPYLPPSGRYDSQTKIAVATIQGLFGLVQDGIAGPATCRQLWRDLLIWFGGVHHVPASQLYGFMMLESVGDPGAVGYTTPSDRGLNQINLIAHPYITVEQAFDPNFSINYTARRLGDARIRFSSKGVDLKNRCAIAQHNSPRDALSWFNTETPPNENIEKYVNLVLGHAINFK